MKTTKPSTNKLQKALPYILIICGLVGLVASFTLTAEKIHLLRDPSYHPACNINPILSCGSVMKSRQAEVAGIPNSLFGVVAFAMVVAIGGAVWFGARMKQWFWRLFNVGLLGGLLAVGYLFYESLYRLKTLCPYCMSVWTVTIILFWYVSLWNLLQGNITLPPRLKKSFSFVQDHHLDILIVVFVVIISVVLNRFWYYFGNL